MLRYPGKCDLKSDTWQEPAILLLLAGIVKRRGGCCAPPQNPSQRLVFWWIPILGLRYVSVIQVGPSAEPFIQSLQSRLNLIRLINQAWYLL